MDPVMTAQGVAELLKCSPRTIEDRARAGTLPGVKFGESWVFPAQALLEAINEQARANTQREREAQKVRALARVLARKPPSLGDRT